jgi:hypothetical protein
MGFLSSKKQKVPVAAPSAQLIAQAPVTPAKTETGATAEADAAAAEERKRLQKMNGRRSTILTGARGLQTAAAPGKKVLLG